MKSRITLIVFNETSPISWKLGEKVNLNYEFTELKNKRESILNHKSEYLLFWNASFPLPKVEELKSIISSGGNLWHVGPKLGLNLYPFTLDYVQPTNMLHLNVNNHIDHSSWKMNFEGCLMEKRIFENIPLNNYSASIDMCGLDFGYKAMKSGVITRYSYKLSKYFLEKKISISKKDQFLFIKDNFDTKAFTWTYLNNFFKVSPWFFVTAIKKKQNTFNFVYKHNLNTESLNQEPSKVSIVIATLNRYETLKKELNEIRNLTIQPIEIIIVDQTPKKNRKTDFFSDYSDLPIIYLESDIIGQCTARNIGISKATGDFIWFLDDDMEEFPKNYLEKHLKTIHGMNADISCGIPDEIGTNFINRDITKVSLSEGFPTNDVLIKKDYLQKVKGFDVKMDQLQSEDQEIGLRCVKEGALSVKNNELRLIHLRAPQGGLRTHKVRKITFSSARNSLKQRRFLHYSEMYLAMKHFSKNQVKNYINLNIRGTFIIRGNILNKILKVLIGIFLLPHTIYVLKKRKKLAKNLLFK